MGMNAVYRGPQDLPETIPVFPLPGALLLPRGQMPLNIFEPRYVAMVDEALRGDRIVGMIQPDAADEDPSGRAPRLYSVGCAGRLTQYEETGDGRYLITLTGVCRFMTGAELSAATPYRQVRVDFAPFEDDLRPPAEDSAFDRERLLTALRHYLQRRDLDIQWETARAAPAEALINSLAMALPFEPAEKQALLEAETLAAREDALVALLEIDAALDDDQEPPPVQ